MPVVSEAVLTQILSQLQSLQVAQQEMGAKIEALTNPSSPPRPEPQGLPISRTNARQTSISSVDGISLSSSVDSVSSAAAGTTESHMNSSVITDSLQGREKSLYPGRVLLTTYPSQHGILPFNLTWGAKDPAVRGPVICSRLPSSIKVRNAIGAHSGSYSIYRALSIAMGSLDPMYKPSYEMTEPPVDMAVPCKSWYGTEGKNMKIVSLDPWGHLVPSVWQKEIKDKSAGGLGLDIRPSISVTRAHIKLKELDDSVNKGDLFVDGKIVLNTAPFEGVLDPGVEVNVSKAAVDPIWYLPGVADRFGISESLLRRALFEDTGGMYPELITRPDIKVFLPPIGGLTVYIFGNPSFLRDPSKILTLRVHDECNGSDVFGSDICTCKPYLVYAIEECIRTAQGRHPDQIQTERERVKQNGGSEDDVNKVEKGAEGVGAVVYFRKEGRALGEVTKYLVYNLRKRGGDSADRYFKSTEMVAGVKDMRFQALMPDVLHWLGINKIDNMVSMSDMKYDAIVESGIPILKRYDIPPHLIPPDSQVEIDAKIANGYFSSGKQVTQEDLKKTVGRSWEEMEH